MPEDDPSASDDLAGRLLEKAADAATGWITGVPTPIRKNAIKAFSQLCTAAIDIPVAYLEGIADEKRAETQGRIKIISTATDQIAVQMNVDPEFARAAVTKYGQRIVRERINLQKTSEAAAVALQTTPILVGDTAKETPPIDDDWLNHFEKEASQKSTAEMQQLFGRILASEIRKPSSFSIKTVKLVGEMDRPIAELFRLLRSCCISLEADAKIIDCRVVSLGGNAASNSLLKYGLSFAALNRLQEYGLIIADYNSYMEYGVSIAQDEQVPFPFTFRESKWTFVPSEPRPAGAPLRVHGVGLSAAGMELFKIVDLVPTDEYTIALVEFFRQSKLKMTEIQISNL